MTTAQQNPFARESASLRSEHISLESETLEAKAKPISRKVVTEFRVRSRARGTETTVAILENHYASVRVKRPRAQDHEHNVDLRFVDPHPIAIRKISRPWIYVTVGLALLTAALIVFSMLFAKPMWVPNLTTAAILLGSLTLSGVLMCVYFATESVVFVSTHGRARVIVITGGIGATRNARQCAVELVKQINTARKKSKQSRQTYLRDEMREHARLRSQDALTEPQYEDARRRILQSHS